MRTKTGSTFPLGTTIRQTGVNFAFHAQGNEATLCIFTSSQNFTLKLDPKRHKTEHIWHVFVEQISPPFEYMIQINGGNLLLDPYAKILSCKKEWGSNVPYAPRAVCMPIREFDWQGIDKPHRPFSEWIIYEMHTRAFTQHPSAKTQNKGCFLAILEKIPHLLNLGINAVELMPIFEFDESDNPRTNPLNGNQLCNFWGYSPIHFFCPMKRYACQEHPDAALLEFKTLVRELHRHGISVILDVVYNHTGEGQEPFSLRGLDPHAYYMLDEQGKDLNFSGTGNTLNCNHPITRKLIVDSLIYWAQDLQVDGFRFDLASIFTRDSKGKVLESAPILEDIKASAELTDAVLIAEAWDAGGLYQVGSFPGKDRWAEWNGKYRDAVRRFIKGTDGAICGFAAALCGSEELYKEYGPAKSVNFVTAHDGYSLCDLVSYQEKHNEANGEDNRDGNNSNESWNCGVEGPSTDSQIQALRLRQMKNFLVALCMSLGVPMLLMGDEYGHTREGNNNPYCQDNALNWFLWDHLEQNPSLLHFWKKLITLRRDHASTFCKNTFFTEQDISWHGVLPLQPDWSERSRFLCYTVSNLLIAFNASHLPITFTLPENAKKTPWRCLANTYDPQQEDSLLSIHQTMTPYSSLIACFEG